MWLHYHTLKRVIFSNLIHRPNFIHLKKCYQIRHRKSCKMDKEDFTYEISFPPPKIFSTDKASHRPSCLETESTEAAREPEPVIFLLGWTGCRDKYLAKYSEFYQQKGSEGLRIVAKKLLALIHEHGLDQNPVFFHMFSNNGSAVYAQMSDILCCGQFRNVSVKGCIIDNDPGKARIAITSYSFAIAQENRRSFFYTTYLYIYAYLFLTGIRAKLSYFSFEQERSVNVHTIFDRIKEDRSKWPQLFFYSKGDNVIPYTDSEEIMKYRAEVLKVQTESQCFDKSDHCGHLRIYREKYIERCIQFIDRYRFIHEHLNIEKQS